MPAGAWPSKITTDMVAGQSRRFGGLDVLPCGGKTALVWSETRPEEGGRGQIMRRYLEHGEAHPWSDATLSARSRVHEYGGGEFCCWSDVNGDAFLVFCDAPSGDLFLQSDDAGPARRLTHIEGVRFAAMAARLRHHGLGNELVMIAEDHRQDTQQPENLLVALTLPHSIDALEPVRDLAEMICVARGADFYASPRYWGDDRLVWLSWNLPAMPWEAASLSTVSLNRDGDGNLRDTSAAVPEKIFDAGEGAVFQPEISDEGSLTFVSDKDGLGQIYRLGTVVGDAAALTQGEIEFMRPQWALGMSSYALFGNGSGVGVGYEEGRLRGCLFSMADSGEQRIDPRFDALAEVQAIAAAGDKAAAIVSIHEHGPSLVSFSRDGSFQPPIEMLSVPVDEAISRGQAVTFDGDQGEPTYGVLYRPANSEHALDDGELPPAIVRVHGGPTGMASRGFDWKTQYWTSRGFTVFDVDYSGSSGYGRAYRDRLNGAWGLRDTRDCIAAAQWLADQGHAQAEAISIMGGSSGGYTVLMALAMSDVFAAGSCYYGISDVTALLAHTHKFESGYIHGLMGTSPDDFRERLEERSPLSMLDEMNAPVIFFQGTEDRVVPPEQTKEIFAALQNKGVTSEMVLYDNEGHGFRAAETIKDTLERNLAFLQQVHGLS